MLYLVARSTLILLLLGAPLLAQTASIGTIEAASATVSGTLSQTGDQSVVGTNTVITARDRTATLALARGGEILVCSTSALHAARGAGASQPDPLLLAIDRGAVEIHMAATGADSILTPDLRFTIATSTGQPAAGLLDLRIRVAGNGDTCVENRGKTSPTLEVAEQFGNGLYQVHPNQHLLFEHGSLREVVDGETSPCGCPPPPVLSIADSGISTNVTRAAHPGARVADDPDEVRPHSPAEAQHPFPAAESQGLTTASAATAVPQAPPGQPHAQVAATLAFGADGKNSDGTGNPSSPDSGTPSKTPPIPAGAASSATSSPGLSVDTSGPPANDLHTSHEIAQTAPPPPMPPPRTLAHRLGHFFRHLFSSGS